MKLPRFMVLMVALIAGLTVTIKASEYVRAWGNAEPTNEQQTEAAAETTEEAIIVIITETEPEAEKQTEPETEPEATYSNADYEILLQVLTGECQNCSWEHQIAVGSVFLNRVASRYYPDTFYGVAHQSGQYACFSDGNAYRTPTQTSKEAARYLMLNGSQLPENCLYQAQFKQGSGVYARYGSTYICYR